MGPLHSAGAIGGGIILLIFGLISAGIFWWIRDQLTLCGQLLSVAGVKNRANNDMVENEKLSRFFTHAGKGLQECPGIIVAAIGIKVAGVAIMVFFFAATILGAYVGKVQVSRRI